MRQTSSSESQTMSLADPIIIHQPWGGLGDNLQFSTLPEGYAALGRPVFISAKNAFRNQEIAELVWGWNPYVQGYSDLPPNAGACVDFSNVPKSLSYIERIEKAHGLPPINRSPKIYYQPIPNRSFTDSIIIDVNSVSVPFPTIALGQYVRSVLKDFGYDTHHAVQIEFPTSPAQGFVERKLPGYGRYRIKNIFEYCDILASSKALITTHSGAYALAVALRRTNARLQIHCYCNLDQFNSRLFIFDGVQYHIDDPALNHLAERKIRKQKIKRLARRMFGSLNPIN